MLSEYNLLLLINWFFFLNYEYYYNYYITRVTEYIIKINM